MLQSMACQHRHFHEEWYARWHQEFAGTAPNFTKHHHRKSWEWAAISQVLFERGMLSEGKRGLGFAVGTEPLPSLFAKYGTFIEATDTPAGETADMWANADQYAGNLDGLYQKAILSREAFDARVKYYHVDMRHISHLDGEYDFIWSSCSLEHLGTLSLGSEFLERSSRLLKPGGVAVHTTEFNCMSDLYTVESGNDVIYRARDILGMQSALRSQGLVTEAANFDAGSDQEDVLFDYPPFYSHGRHHIKLFVDGFVATSFLLVASRPGA